MKRLLFVAVICACVAAPAFADFVSGWDPLAINYGGIRLKNLRLSGNGGEVYLGTNLGNGATRVQNDFVYSDQWGFGDTEVNFFEFSFDVDTGWISSKVTTASGAPQDWTLAYNMNPPLPLNYMQMTLVARAANTSLSVTDLTLNGDDLGDYLNVTGWNDWKMYGDFNNDFTLSGKLTLYGYSTGDENNKVQFMVGNVVPVPGAVLLGILGLGAAGVKLRKFA